MTTKITHSTYYTGIIFIFNGAGPNNTNKNNNTPARYNLYFRANYVGNLKLGNFGVSKKLFHGFPRFFNI